ncbi:MAG: hypothetical protein HRF40_10840 [Nitrososphaera sp.]
MSSKTEYVPTAASVKSIICQAGGREDWLTKPLPGYLELADHILDTGLFTDAWRCIAIIGMPLVLICVVVIVASLNVFLRYTRHEELGMRAGGKARTKSTFELSVTRLLSTAVATSVKISAVTYRPTGPAAKEGCISATGSPYTECMTYSAAKLESLGPYRCG